MHTKLIIKFIIAVIISIAYNILMTAIYPIMNNTIAVQQLEDTPNSFVDNNLLNSCQGYFWIIPVILILILFRSEIKNIIKFIKEEK